MVMGVGKGKPKGSYPAKFNIIDSSGYDQQHGVVVRFLLAYRPKCVPSHSIIPSKFSDSAAVSGWCSS